MLSMSLTGRLEGNVLAGQVNTIPNLPSQQTDYRYVGRQLVVWIAGAQVRDLLHQIGQNPSEAEVQVGVGVGEGAGAGVLPHYDLFFSGCCRIWLTSWTQMAQATSASRSSSK